MQFKCSYDWKKFTNGPPSPEDIHIEETIEASNTGDAFEKFLDLHPNCPPQKVEIV